MCEVIKYILKEIYGEWYVEIIFDYMENYILYGYTTMWYMVMWHYGIPICANLVMAFDKGCKPYRTSYEFECD